MSSKTQTYNLLLQQAQALLTQEYDVIANMSNLTALLFNNLPQVNSVAFYRWQNHELILGPLQGPPACMHIALGKGVCGTVAQELTTKIVPNVLEFAGHIACDPHSRSEIVIPIFQHNHFWGELDLDSPQFNHFDTIDATYLEQIAPLVFGYTPQPNK